MATKKRVRKRKVRVKQKREGAKGAQSLLKKKESSKKETCNDCTTPNGQCHDDALVRHDQKGREKTYEPVPVEILESRRMGRHHLLRVQATARYDPGQFFQVTSLGYGEAPISIASHHHEYVDFLINPVGTVTRELTRKKKGDTLLIRGPYGYGYPMHYFRNNNLLLVGGGCGVAPLKGVLDYLASHRAHYKHIHCFFGYREPKESIYEKEMNAWEREGTFDFTYAYSDVGASFNGNKGYISPYLEASNWNPRDSVALICGPPPMMRAAIDSLHKLGFTDDQVWLSHERHMKCATGMCGHCMIEGKYTCKDGPVFRLDWITASHG